MTVSIEHLLVVEHVARDLSGGGMGSLATVLGDEQDEIYVDEAKSMFDDLMQRCTERQYRDLLHSSWKADAERGKVTFYGHPVDSEYLSEAFDFALKNGMVGRYPLEDSRTDGITFDTSSTSGTAVNDGWWGEQYRPPLKTVIPWSPLPYLAHLEFDTQEEEMATRRLVRVLVYDPDPDVPDESALIYHSEAFLTSMSDVDVRISRGAEIMAALKLHNTMRAELADDDGYALKPVTLADVVSKCVTVA